MLGNGGTLKVRSKLTGYCFHFLLIVLLIFQFLSIRFSHRNRDALLLRNFFLAKHVILNVQDACCRAILLTRLSYKPLLVGASVNRFPIIVASLKHSLFLHFSPLHLFPSLLLSALSSLSVFFYFFLHSPSLSSRSLFICLHISNPLSFSLSLQVFINLYIYQPLSLSLSLSLHLFPIPHSLFSSHSLSSCLHISTLSPLTSFSSSLSLICLHLFPFSPLFPHLRYMSSPFNPSLIPFLSPSPFSLSPLPLFSIPLLSYIY